MTHPKYPLNLARTAGGFKVDDALLAPVATARNAFIKMCGALVEADSKTVQALLKKKLSLLVSMDSTFVIELAVLEALAGDSGMLMIQDEVVKMMPTKAKPAIVSLDTVSARLSVLKNGSLYKYCGSKGQTSLDVVSSNFEQMLQGREPRVDALKTSAFFASIPAALPLFCYITIQIAGAVAKVTHYGEKAIEIIRKEAIVKDTAKTLSFADLNDLHVYGWILTAAQKTMVEDLTKKVLAGLSSKQATKKAKVDPMTKAVKAKKAEEANEDSVMNLFV